MNKLKKTIGITMRIIEEIHYDEQRDTLAHNWNDFLAWSMGDDINWILIPNLGSDAVCEFAQSHQLEGIILSGGNDVGEYPLRDETEFALIDYAIDHHLPIVGVCRGLQIIWQHFGGELRSLAENHIASRHTVNICQSMNGIASSNTTLEVNSFHGFGLSEKFQPRSIIPFARTDEGDVEAVIWKEARIFAMMWHPEREKEFSEMDRK